MSDKYRHQGPNDGTFTVSEHSTFPAHVLLTITQGGHLTNAHLPHSEAAAAMLGIARAAGWKTHAEQVETEPQCTPGTVEDWQADVVASLLGAIRKAADDKVKAEAEAEELDHAANLLAAYIPSLTLGDARRQLQGDADVRRTWLTVVRAARAQFAPNTLPF